MNFKVGLQYYNDLLSEQRFRTDSANQRSRITDVTELKRASGLFKNVFNFIKIHMN